jgi:hypothetical protein
MRAYYVSSIKYSIREREGEREREREREREGRGKSDKERWKKGMYMLACRPHRVLNMFQCCRGS